MILLVPESSHSPLAGAAAPANVSRSLPAAPVREPKIWEKENPELPFFLPAVLLRYLSLGNPLRAATRVPVKIFRYFRMVLLPKKGVFYIISPKFGRPDK